MDERASHPGTLIILSPDQGTFYEFLKSRQEAQGGTLVILDRRQRDPVPWSPFPTETARGDRRVEAPQAALALMSVLGFMILHRDGDHWQA